MQVKKKDNINRTADGCIKNLRGKIIAKPREKLPCVRSITTKLIPEIECFAVLEVDCGKPFVVVWGIADPSYEELPSTAAPPQIDYFVDHVLF
jgi:hypothetical protein